MGVLVRSQKHGPQCFLVDLWGSLVSLKNSPGCFYPLGKSSCSVKLEASDKFASFPSWLKGEKYFVFLTGPVLTV